jgi:hypothetical protein
MKNCELQLFSAKKKIGKRLLRQLEPKLLLNVVRDGDLL